MKVINKKTGEKGIINLKIYGDESDYLYDTLEGLCEEWAVVKEALIKDPKVRKAVRAWAEVNEFEPDYTVKYSAGMFGLNSGQADINFNAHIEGLKGGKVYTIEELCGIEEQ